MKLSEMNAMELDDLYHCLSQKYADFQALGLKLNMSRGKPSFEQLELCNDIHDRPHSFICEDGTDVRNYTALDGIPEAKQLFGEILNMPAENVLVGGNSSLNLMYDTVCRAYLHGVLAAYQPWSQQGTVKFLCPVPGYDRHFSLTESFGIEMIPVPMTAAGPDMEIVEKLVAADSSIKGIWCVPMYSNPVGITFSDEVVRRFATMQTAAADFRIFWDNAYCVHHLDHNDRDYLLNIYQECLRNGTEDRVYIFTSTSKITMAGSGVCAVAMSRANLDWTLKWLNIQTICHDNVNQFKHALYLPGIQAVESLMARHAALIKPKFQIVLDALAKEIAPLAIADWHSPKGGYFISFNAQPGCAKRIVELCRQAGMELTGAGATYPYGKDPLDSNIRIAPTFPAAEELMQAMELFCIAVQMATIEKLTNK